MIDLSRLITKMVDDHGLEIYRVSQVESPNNELYVAWSSTSTDGLWEAIAQIVTQLSRGDVVISMVPPMPIPGLTQIFDSSRIPVSYTVLQDGDTAMYILGVMCSTLLKPELKNE